MPRTLGYGWRSRGGEASTFREHQYLTVTTPAGQSSGQHPGTKGSGALAAYIGVALAVIVFLVDLLVLPRHMLAYRDSLEVVTASYLLQAAHPPGYPLYVLLGKLFTWPLGWIDPVYTRYAVLNSVYGVALLTLFYHCGLLLTGESLLSALATLALGWSYTFWFYRILPEVFMMANLAAVLSLYLLLRWRGDCVAGAPRAHRWWSAFSFSVGLGLVCHHTTVLWWPGFAWLAIATAPQRALSLALRAFGPLLAGITPFLLVFLMGYLPHRPMWGNGPGLTDFAHYLLRTDYGGLANAGPIADQAAVSPFWGPLSAYLAQAWVNFGPAFLLAPAGLWLFWHRGSRFLGFLPLTLFLAGPVFVTYGRYKTDTPFNLGSLEAFYLPSFITFVLMCLVLVDCLLAGYSRARTGAAVILAMLATFQLFRAYPLVDRHESTLSKGYGRSLLGQLPDRAVLLVSDDRDIFTAYYSTWVARMKPKLAIINQGFLHKPAYRSELLQAYPDLVINPSLTPGVFMRRFLSDNVGRDRPIYLATLRYAGLWGCEGNPFTLRPRGKVFEVLRDDGMVPGDRLMLPFNDQLTRPYPGIDFWDQDLLNGYRLAWRNLGSTYTRLGLLRRARALYDQLTQIEPGNPEWQAALVALEGRPDTFRRRTNRDYRPTDAAAHDRAAMALIRANVIEKAIQEMEIAVQLDPRNAKYADKLAVLLASMRDYGTALPYVQRAVRLDPRNEKYREDLEYVLSRQ